MALMTHHAAAFAVLLTACSSAQVIGPDPEVQTSAPVPVQVAGPKAKPAPVAPSQAQQADALQARLQGARTLRCAFTKTTSVDWEPSGALKTETRDERLAFDFDAVDLEKHRARVLGNQGASDVSVHGTGGGVTFVELTASGNFITTTVAPWLAPSGEFAAVHSRHVIVAPGMPPVFSQFYGTCKPL